MCPKEKMICGDSNGKKKLLLQFPTRVQFNDFWFNLIELFTYGNVLKCILPFAIIPWLWDGAEIHLYEDIPQETMPVAPFTNMV